MKKINVLLLFLILALSLGAAPIGLLAQDSEVVALVNGVAITRDEFLGLLEKEYGVYALQELVGKQLVDQKAEELGITVDDAEFDAFYQMVIAQLGGYEGLYMFLLENNATEDMFIEELRWNMLLNELAGSEVEVTEEAVLEWFEANRGFYDEPESVEVSHILVETEEEARELLDLIVAGGDLAGLAEEHSTDPGTAVQGGYLGTITRGVTVPGFEELAFSLGVGEFGLSESDFGWHIITVHSKNEAKAAVYAEIAESVERDYRSTQALDGQSYMRKLEQEAELEILWQP